MINLRALQKAPTTTHTASICESNLLKVPELRARVVVEALQSTIERMIKSNWMNNDMTFRDYLYGTRADLSPAEIDVSYHKLLRMSKAVLSENHVYPEEVREVLREQNLNGDIDELTEYNEETVNNLIDIGKRVAL